MIGLGLDISGRSSDSAINYQQLIIDRTPALYLDATDSVKVLNGDKVSSITSLVGSTSATQGTDSLRPVLGENGNYNTLGFNLPTGTDDDYLALPGAFNIGVFDDSFSISFVIQPQEPVNGRFFFGFLDATDGVRIQDFSGQLYIFYRAGGNFGRWRSSGQWFPDDRLNPIVITLTVENSGAAGGIKAYVDDGNGGRAELSNDGSYTGDMSSVEMTDWISTDDHWIGAYNNVATTYFEGDINAVIIDSKIISETEFFDMVNLYTAP